MVLVTAWGLLAVGMLVQVVRGGDPATEANEDGDPSQQLAFDAADGAIDPTIPSTAPDGAEPGSDKRDGSTSNSPTLEADDPARWDQAGPVMARESLVATVTTSGVASLSEPAPGAVQHFFPNPTQFGGDRAFLVLDNTSSADYVKVSLPVMPNGQEGWIPRSEVEIRTVEHRAVVDLSDDSVTVWNGDEVIVDTKAVTGKPSTPTPLGVFYVRDVIPQPNAAGSYGPYILALSGFSEVLDTFNGGLPALAIHGTNNPDQIGSERSSGCVRIPNDLISILAETVPLGTPVSVIA